jgi:signal transduction histidine kinase/putative methionine-R-sulfoxide reductase with GAF domain
VTDTESIPSEQLEQLEGLATRLAQMYLVLSRTNRAISRAADEAALLQAVCQTVVSVGRMRMSWIGSVDRESNVVTPVAHAGHEDGYLEAIGINLEGPRSEGPTGQAIRLRATVSCDDIATDPRMAPWRDAALARGYRSSIGLPLYKGEALFGVLTAYADEPHRFDASEIELLEELARDVSFGLTTLAEAAERLRAEAALTASEQRFVTTAELLLDPFVIMRASRDSSGRIVDFIYDFANDAAYEANHMPRSEDLVGRSLLSFLPPHHGSGLLDLYAHCVDTGELVVLDDVSYEDVSAGQRLERFFDIRGRSLGDSIAVTWRDVTERRQAEMRRAEELERKVRERTAELEAAGERTADLARLSTAILTAGSREEIADQLLESTKRVSGAVDGIVGLVTTETEGISVIGTFGFARESVLGIASSPPSVRTPMRDAARSGTAIVLEHSEDFAREYAAIAAVATETLDRARVAFPMRAGDRTVGGVSLGFEPRPFSENEMAFFFSIANAAALGIERLRLEQAEREARGMLDVVVAQMPVGVTIVGRDGRLLYRNAAYDAIAHCTYPVVAEASSAPEASFAVAVDPWKCLRSDGTEYAPGDVPVARSLASGEVVVNEEVRVVRTDATEAVILQTSAPIFDSIGEIAGAVVVTLDISERKQAEQLRDAFLGVLSHELRTPVTTIYAASQFLASRGERLDLETRKELAEDIVAESERLDRMVDDLLVLARAERGFDMTVRGAALVQHKLALVISSLAAAWPDRRFDCQTPEDVPPVTGDEDYLEHVLRNLIGNAAKYGRSLVSAQVLVRADAVSIVVSDDGPGIDEAERERIFELFTRLKSTSRLPGAGIGLFVVRRLVEAMGGTVSVANRTEGGAAFTVVLPRYVEAVEAVEG